MENYFSNLIEGFIAGFLLLFVLPIMLFGVLVVAVFDLDTFLEGMGGFFIIMFIAFSMFFRAIFGIEYKGKTA